jgi:hypothetical protein
MRFNRITNHNIQLGLVWIIVIESILTYLYTIVDYMREILIYCISVVEERRLYFCCRRAGERSEEHLQVYI